MMRSDVTHEWKEYLRSIDVRPPTDDHIEDIEKSWYRKRFLGNSGRSVHLEYYRMALNGKASEINLEDSPQLQAFVNSISDFQPLTKEEIRNFSEEILTETALKLLNRDSKKKSRIYRGLEDIVYLDHSLNAMEKTLVTAVQELTQTLSDRKQLIAEKNLSAEDRSAQMDKLTQECSREVNHVLLEICRNKRSSLREEAQSYVIESLLLTADSSSSRFAQQVSGHLQEILQKLDPSTNIDLSPEHRASLEQSVRSAIKSPNSGYPNESANVHFTLNLDQSTKTEIFQKGSRRDTISASNSNINTGDGDQYSESDHKSE